MKKLLSMMLALLITASVSFAQTGKTEKNVTKSTTETSVKTKKDGTPDMRFKENKETKTASTRSTTTKLKKDGTADMRYKENKQTTKSSVTTK